MNVWVAFGVGVFLGAVFILFVLSVIAAIFRHSWEDDAGAAPGSTEAHS